MLGSKIWQDIYLYDVGWDRLICIGFEHLLSQCTFTLWPFVPHNLRSAQESPFLSPKFQMAPILKILISSGSKKGTQIYCPFFSQKVLASESPPGSQMGALGREIPAFRACLRLS